MTTGRPSSGYSAWRLIAEELRGGIGDGSLPPGHRLPTEQQLADRFGVNRHTVRQAVASLAEEGLVEARRGSGTYVTGERLHLHRIGLRTRLSASLGSGAAATGRVVESAVEEAPEEVRERLQPGGPVIRVETLRMLDGTPLTRATHWFDAEQLPDIAALLRRTGSVTAALRAVGIEDYLRSTTTISARPATAAEAADLELEPGAVVLVTRSLDTMPDGAPLQYVVTRFDARRVALEVEHPASAAPPSR